MNQERKRKAPEQQSAIAKLRKARENSNPTTPADASSTQPTRQNPQALPVSNGSVQVKSKRRVKQAPAAPTLATEQNIPDANPYAALPYKQSWDGNREYERVSASNLRVELAEGTGCVILGRCTIWVKHGTVSVLGATLEPGPELHRLSAPICNALPTIEAKDRAAEIELGTGLKSDHIQQPALGLCQPPEQLRDPANDLPFYVLGLNFHWSPNLPKQYPILTLQDEHFVALHRRHKAPGILLCGPRSFGIATLARSLLNRALTSSNSNTPVIFVDLDPILPVLTPPGTIGVSTVSSPILGPQFSWLDRKGAETSCLHFVGSIETVMEPTSWYRTCLADITSKVEGLRKQHPKATLVVLAADSLNLAGPNHVEEFLTKLAISSVTTIEGNGSPSISQTLQMMETHDIPVHIVPSINENPHTSRQHHLSLRAHLDEQQAHFGPVVDDTSLIYSGPTTQLLAVALPEGHMLASGLELALPDLLVAVVVVEERAVDGIRQTVRRCPTSGMPVLPTLCSLDIEARYTQCLGLSLISKVDVESGIVSIRTALLHTSIFAQVIAGAGARLLLLVQPPTRDGKFAIASTRSS